MARIRTTKPEFWTSEQVVECSIETRLLFIGLWNFCDDAGIHPASCKRLKMEIYPADDYSSSDIRRMIDELIDHGLVIEYTAKNVDYWQVTGWNHQKIDKPTYKYPQPDRRALVETSPPEWKGREGKGREGKNPLSDKPDDAPVNGKKNQNQQYRDDAVLLLKALNGMTGKNFRFVDTNLNLIKQRLKSGIPRDTLHAMIGFKCRQWKGTDQEQYLRPSTLFGKEKCEQYIGQLPGRIGS